LGCSELPILTVIVSSIPYTGTFLVCEFLDHIGKGFIHTHLSDLPYDNDFVIMPVRDPALHFLSYRKRNPRMRFDSILSDVCGYWERFIVINDEYDPFLVPTDKGEKAGISVLTELALKFGIEKNYYGWPVVGNFSKEPTTIDEYESVSEPEKKIIFARLADVRKKVGYGH